MAGAWPSAYRCLWTLRLRRVSALFNKISHLTGYLLLLLVSIESLRRLSRLHLIQLGAFFSAWVDSTDHQSLGLSENSCWLRVFVRLG